MSGYEQFTSAKDLYKVNDNRRSDIRLTEIDLVSAEDGYQVAALKIL